MMRTIGWNPGRTSRRAGSRRGIALLTVVALLSFFAVVGTAFTFTMRLEEQTARNFQRTTRVHDAAMVGAEVAAAALRRDLLGPDGIAGSGDEFSYFDSERDGWFNGYAGRVDLNAHFMARGHLSAIDARTAGLPTLRTSLAADIPTLIARGAPNRLFSLGVDEDPPGDLNGDGAPGIAGVDDDGDGWADFEDPDVIASIASAKADPQFDYDPASDDDEDGRMDEDGVDIVSAGGMIQALPPGEGLDADGDRTGVEDESAKLNINAVGNLSGGNRDLRYHRHNQGVSTFEIDPVLYFIARGVSLPHAVTLGRNLVLYRNGTRPGTAAPHNGMPGLDGPNGAQSVGDDNGNNNPDLLQIDSLGHVSGDGLDNDHDGFTDEPDEGYIGNNWNEPVTRIDGLLVYGDGIDNDGDGLIDESGSRANPDDPTQVDELGYDEGVNEPQEFNPERPRGDDNPFDTLDELRLVEGFGDVVDSNPWTGEDWTLFDYLKNYLTAYSSSPVVNPAYAQAGGEGPLNVNRLSPYTPDEYRLNVLDLLALQVDNDGDWNPAKDDFNANGRPDSDWDGFGEASAADGLDNDGDGLVDDDGDFNQDGLIRYDPEYHVNEDPVGDRDGELDALGRPMPGLPGEDDDLDGLSDLDDLEVARALDPVRRVDVLDRRDNDWNNAVWLSDGLDNDFDGRIDETREDELAAGVPDQLARDEGIDEVLTSVDNLPIAFGAAAVSEFSSLERYYPPYDDDEDGRMDEDPPEFDFLVHLADSIDLPKLKKEGDNRLQGDDVTTLAALRYNAREVANAPNDITLQDNLPDELKRTMNYSGSEGIYINEVMVRPVIVLQAELASVEVQSGLTDPVFPPLPPDADTIWDLGPDGSYFFVNNNSDPQGSVRIPEDETAVWTYDSIDLPAVTSGEYEIYFYTHDDTALLGGTQIFVDFSPDGVTWPWSVSIASLLPQPNATITLPNGAAALRVRITVPETSDGVATFDRIELFNREIQYIELVNLTPRRVDMSKYELGLNDNDDTRVAIDDSAIVPGGAVTDYALAPYRHDEPGQAKNLLLLAYKAVAGELDNAYALPGGAVSSIPSGITYLENEAFQLFTDTTYEEIANAEDPAKSVEPTVLQLFDPAGNLIDSFTVDRRVKTPNNSGFLAQQRADLPTEGKFERLGDVFVKKATPRRLELWKADAVLAKRGGAPVDVFGAADYWSLYWEDDPDYPGRIAFKFGTSETDALDDEVRFAFNLSRRFPDLDYDLVVGGDKYYLDAFVNAPPWSATDSVGVLPLPVGAGETDALSWAPAVGAGFAAPVQSGALWRTVEVLAPGDNLPLDLKADSWLVVTVSPPRDSLGLLAAGWEDIRIESVDLADHGAQDRSTPTTGVLELRGGSPGRPSSLLRSGQPLVRDGNLPSPLAIAGVGASGSEWVLSASDVSRLASRFTTHEGLLSGEAGDEVRGLINLNTAPASVLCALPWLPPKFFEEFKTRGLSLPVRYNIQFTIHGLIAQRLVEGRGELNSAGLTLEDVDDDNDGFVDEGPFEEVGDILRVLGDRYLRDQIEAYINPALSLDPLFKWDRQEQMAAFERVSGLATTRSNVFTVNSRGRITEEQEGEIALLADRAVVRTIAR